MFWTIVKIALETLFFLGMAGSLLVVCLTLIEDVGVFRTGEDEKAKPASDRQVAESSQLQQPSHLSQHLSGSGVL
jgi:hypothetical protein